MNENNSQKGTLAITYLFERENIFQNIDAENTMKNELKELVLKWKKRGLINRFVIADDEVLKEEISNRII